GAHSVSVGELRTVCPDEPEAAERGEDGDGGDEARGGGGAAVDRGERPGEGRGRGRVNSLGWIGETAREQTLCVPSRARAVGGTLRQERVDDEGEAARQSFAVRDERRRQCGRLFDEHGRLQLIYERRPARQHLVE